MMSADIGLIGLAVMGQNLVLNMADHGWKVAVFNRTASKTEEFLQGPAKKSSVIGAYTLPELVSSLRSPRKIMLMVKAGEIVDQFIEQLIPLLSPGDLIIDGGNSLFVDTNRRCKNLKEKRILFVGTGISGGEEGARYGPSIMPGGDPEGWPLVQNIFQSISAKVDGQPCCTWVGEGGAGHFVKMVHNGIEYGDMQLIAEAYHLLKEIVGLSPDEIATVFSRWNEGELNSYLVEITASILRYKEANGLPLIDVILDAAGQKGTGKWTVVHALELGVPVSLMGEAVFARCLSALKEERADAASQLLGPLHPPKISDQTAFIRSVEHALYASKLMSYAQGFMLMQEAARQYQWHLDLGSIALMWRGGCIIRSRFLGQIKEAFTSSPNLKNLLLAPYFVEQVQRCQEGWRCVVAKAAEQGIPVPCFSTALSFYDGYRSSHLPANLIQAQRDFFGAHTYERTDRPRGLFFHTNWTGTGGNISSTSYNV